MELSVSVADFSARSGHDPGLLLALSREAHVWFARPQLALDLERRNDLLSILAESEKDRYRRFVFGNDRDHYLAAHVLVRTVLSHYVAVPPNKWKFTANRYGRPEISREFDMPFLRFNLSHTNGLVVCIVADEIDCGVDVEAIRPFAGYLSIAKRIFTEEEYENLLGAPIDGQYEAFFNYWTLKEAYIKARGLGLSLSTTSFGFSMGVTSKISIRVNEGDDDRWDAWQFELLRPTGGHVAALAIKSGSGLSYSIKQRWLVGAT